MSEKRSLGRGLDDLIHEVSSVKAMPVQPAADVPAPATPVVVTPAPAPALPAPTPIEPASETPAPVEAATPAPAVVAEALTVAAPGAVPPPPAEPAPVKPVLLEERPADAVINANQKPRVEREIVKQPFVPVWAWGLMAAGIIVAVVLGVLMNKTNGQLDKSREEAKALRAELKRDKLAWIEKIKGRGFTIERRNADARIVFDAPVFAADARPTPFAEDALRALIVPLSDHAADIRMVIVGHTGLTPPRAGQGTNYDIGLRRADVIRRLLVDVAGWPAGGVSVRSAGEKDPPYPGNDPLSQARNRTVTIEISAR